MDAKQFQNDSVRRRFARAHIHEMCPILNFICNFMEKHVKTDKRQEGRYNLVYLIEKVSEFDLKNVPGNFIRGRQKFTSRESKYSNRGMRQNTME